MIKYKKYKKQISRKRRVNFLRSKFFWVGILSLSVLSVVVYIFFFSGFFFVKEVLISGNQKSSKQDMQNIVQDYFYSGSVIVNKNIFLANFGTISKTILQGFPIVADVKIARIFPDTITLKVTERQKVATFCAPDNNASSTDGQRDNLEQCFFVDKNGVIFEQTNAKNIYQPEIKNGNEQNNLPLGQQVMDKDLLASILDVFAKIKDLNINVSNITIASPDRINVLTVDGWQMYFDPTQDLDWQTTKLKAVLDDSIPVDKRSSLDYIELRFGNLAPFKYRD